jgi:dCMP deaminase
VISSALDLKRKSFAMSAKVYLDIAMTISEQSPCTRARVGAVVFREDRKTMLSTGYNGQARKSDKLLCGGLCCDRDRLQIQSGDRIEIGCIHAEMNAISNAVYEGIALAGASIVVTAPPCLICAKLIVQSGIKRVYYRGGDRWVSTGEEFLKGASVDLISL